jgi:hypothetical protein
MDTRTRRRRALFAAAGIANHPDTPEPASAALSSPQSPETSLPAPITRPDASPPPTEPLSGSPELVGRSEPKRPPCDSTPLADQLDALVAALPPDTATDQLIAAYLAGAADAARRLTA